MSGSKQSHLSEAAILAGLSAFSYGVAYAYKSGVSSHFGIPPLLITPTIGTVLQAASAMGIFILISWVIANSIWSFAPRNSTILAQTIRRLLILAFLIGFALFPTLDLKIAWIIFAAILVFFIFIDLIFPLIAQQNIKGYEQKLLAQATLENKSQNFSLGEKVNRTLGKYTMRLVALGIIFLSFSNLLGIKTAKEKTDFFKLTDVPGFVVVDMDDNTIVLAGYDSKTLTLTGLYQVEHFSDSAPRTFKLEHVGKLAVAPKTK